jgi:tRNA(fMet)-specific endonuclease VapC
MSLLYDTNILVCLVKNLNHRQIARTINPDNQKVFISVATVGEIKSIALQNNWASKRLQSLAEILDKVFTVEINENLINTYSEIDAFSQRRNPSYSDYSFSTPRNMGKNDLWIAATATLLGLRLVTTDNDFNHLHQVFLEVRLIKPEQMA